MSNCIYYTLLIKEPHKTSVLCIRLEHHTFTFWGSLNLNPESLGFHQLRNKIFWRSTFVNEMKTHFWPRILNERDILRSHIVQLMDQSGLHRSFGSRGHKPSANIKYPALSESAVKKTFPFYKQKLTLKWSSPRPDGVKQTPHSDSTTPKTYRYADPVWCTGKFFLWRCVILNWMREKWGMVTVRGTVSFANIACVPWFLYLFCHIK